MVAVADDLLIADPGSALGTAGRLMTVGGPAVYLIGDTLFRLRMITSVSAKRIAAVGALAVIGAIGEQLPALALSGAVTALLTTLCLSEYEPLLQRLHPRHHSRPLPGPSAARERD
jgi:low temperature requirement protein LtrA